MSDSTPSLDELDALARAVIAADAELLAVRAAGGDDANARAAWYLATLDFESACQAPLIRALLARLRVAEQDAARYVELRRLLFEDMAEVERLRCLSPSDFDARLAAAPSPTGGER